jgi:hypothetical protein
MSNNASTLNTFTIATMSAATTNNLTQCFWHATGELVCERVAVNTAPASYRQFDSFSKPNASYNPNAYLQNVDWYNTHKAPCCNVPCKSACAGASPSSQSPPRDGQSIHFKPRY